MKINNVSTYCNIYLHLWKKVNLKVNLQHEYNLKFITQLIIVLEVVSCAKTTNRSQGYIILHNFVYSSYYILDHSLLLPPLSSAAQNGNARVQPFMLRKLSGNNCSIMTILKHLCLHYLCAKPFITLYIYGPYSIDIIPDVYQQKPALVQRAALPVLWKVLSLRSPATGEAKSALQTLCRSLYLCMGSGLESLMTQQPPDQQQRLRDILHNLS